MDQLHVIQSHKAHAERGLFLALDYRLYHDTFSGVENLSIGILLHSGISAGQVKAIEIVRSLLSHTVLGKGAGIVRCRDDGKSIVGCTQASKDSGSTARC